MTKTHSLKTFAAMYPLYQPHLSQINKVANLCHYGIQKHDSVSDNGVTHSSM